MTREQLLSENEKRIHSIVLTKEEEAEAYFEGQKKKFFKEKHKQYWDELEERTNSDNS